MRLIGNLAAKRNKGFLIRTADLNRFKLTKKAGALIQCHEVKPRDTTGKMESETAWDKALCRLFFCASKEKAYSKQSGWKILL